MCSLLIHQTCTDRPMDGATGNPFLRPLLYWPVRATVRRVDSTLLAGAAGIYFQACSFNHSDISPFRVNDLRAVGLQITPRRRRMHASLDLTLESNGLRTRTGATRGPDSP